MVPAVTLTVHDHMFRVVQSDLPVATFADNLDFEVVDAAGSRDWVCGPHGCCVFVVLAMTYGKKKIHHE